MSELEAADLGVHPGLGFPVKQGGLLAYRRHIGDAAMRHQVAIGERRDGPRFHLPLPFSVAEGTHREPLTAYPQ